MAVMPQDTLYITGDFAWVKTKERAEYFRDAINCNNVILIWGNHDNRQLLKGLFQGYYDILEVKINKQHIVMCHYPLLAWNRDRYGSIMLHGHCHGNMDTWKKDNMKNSSCFDIGVDCYNYKPVSFEEILEVIENKKS